MAMYKVSPDVKPMNQPTSSTCWLSSLQMLFQWKIDKGSSVSGDKDSILAAMDKSPNLFPYYMEKAGIAPGECKETAKMLGLRWAGGGDIDAQVLRDALKSHGPYWVAGNWGSGSHVIVVTACNPDLGTIRYVDPWKNYTLADSPGTISWLNGRGSVWKNCDASLIYWL